jgi:hypothetical protein
VAAAPKAVVGLSSLRNVAQHRCVRLMLPLLSNDPTTRKLPTVWDWNREVSIFFGVFRRTFFWREESLLF